MIQDTALKSKYSSLILEEKKNKINNNVGEATDAVKFVQWISG
jgi:hypothetical protein